jgi:two-component system, NarL family, nitrate/nitrite response regulator NarL
MFNDLAAGSITTDDGVQAGGSVRAQRRGASTVRPAPTLHLVADPDPVLLERLSAGLLYRGVDRVIEFDAADDVDEVLTTGQVGDLAVIGLGFGASAFRLIRSLRETGWPRVIALVPTTEPGPLTRALKAGATGVLRPPPGLPDYPQAPATVPTLSDQEIRILRLIADGRSKVWIGERMSVSPLTVQNHLSMIARKFGFLDHERLVPAAIRAGLID